MLVAQLLYLANDDPDKDITLYINSPGGSVSAGMAIYDAMQVCALYYSYQYFESFRVFFLPILSYFVDLPPPPPLHLHMQLDVPPGPHRSMCTCGCVCVGVFLSFFFLVRLCGVDVDAPGWRIVFRISSGCCVHVVACGRLESGESLPAYLSVSAHGENKKPSLKFG